MSYRNILISPDSSEQTPVALVESFNPARPVSPVTSILHILDGSVKQIITTLATIIMLSSFVFGQTSDKPLKKDKSDVIIAIKNKSQDTLNAGIEYDVSVKVPPVYKHNFTISVTGATIQGANGKYKIKISRSSKATVIITSANGRTLLFKKDYVIIK